MSSYPPPPELRPQPPTAMPADLSTNPNPALPTTQEPEHPRPAPIWLQRVSLLIQVMFCVYLGILLMILPWWPHLIDSNEFILSFPVLHTFLTYGAVRGILSGIGIVDIWIGISEVIHYQEVRR